MADTVTIIGLGGTWAGVCWFFYRCWEVRLRWADRRVRAEDRVVQ